MSIDRAAVEARISDYRTHAELFTAGAVTELVEFLIADREALKQELENATNTLKNAQHASWPAGLAAPETPAEQVTADDTAVNGGDPQ
jgi:hypothetical protein